MTRPRSVAPGFFRLCLAAVLASLPLAAAAQTQPIPTLPSTGGETSQSPQPDTTTVPTGSPLSSWDYALGLGGGWESNLGQLAPEGPSDWAGVMRATIERVVRRPRREVRLRAGGSGYLYAKQTAFNRLDGSLGFDGKVRFSPRANGVLALGFDYGHSDSSNILIDQVVFLPQTRTLGYAADAGLQHRVSRNLTLRAGARAYRMDFPDSEALRDSTSLRMTAGVSRHLGLLDSLSFEYSAERTDRIEPITEISSPAVWTHFESAQWAHTLSPHTAFLVEAGVSFTPLSAEAGLDRSWNFFGGASLSHQLRRNSVTAYYRREVLPAFGVGPLHLVNRVGLKANVPVGGAFSIVTAATYGREVQTSLTSFDPRSVMDVSLRLARSLGWRVLASLEGRYRRQSAPGFFLDVDDYRAGFFVSLVPPRPSTPGP